MSTNGASANVGTTSTDVGDYTTLLLDINPTLVTGVYPVTYTQFTVTISVCRQQRPDAWRSGTLLRMAVRAE